MKLNDFLVRFGVEVDTKKLEKFGQQVKNVANEANNLIQNAKQVREALVKVTAVATLATAGISYVGAKVASAVTAPLKDIEKLAAEQGNLFEITKDNIAIAKKYQEAGAKTAKMFQNIKTQLALNLAPAITEIINKFNNFIQANKALIRDGIEKVTKGVLFTIQVFTNTAKAIDKVVSSTIGWKKLLIGLAGLFSALFVTSPIGLVISAISALMLLLDDLMVHMNGGKSMFGKAWDPFISAIKTIKKLFDGLNFDKIINLAKNKLKEWGGAAKEVLGVFGEVFTYIKDKAKDIIANFAPVLPFFADMAKAIGNIFKSIFKAIGNLIGLITAILAGDGAKMKEYFVKIFNNIIDILLNIFLYFVNKTFAIFLIVLKVFLNIGNAIKEGLIKVFSKIGNFIKEKFAEAVIAIKNSFDTLKKSLSSIWNKIKTFFIELGAILLLPFKLLFTGIKTVFQAIFNFIKNTFLNIIKQAKETFFKFYNFIIQPFIKAFNFVLDFIKNIFLSIYNYIKNIFLDITKAIKNAFTKNFEFVKKIFLSIYKLTKEKFSGAITVIKNSFNILKESLNSILNKIKAFFSKLGSVIKIVFSAIFNFIKNGFLNTINAVKTLFNTIWKSLKKGFSKAWEFIKKSFSKGLENLKSNFSKIYSFITDPFIKAFNWIKEKFQAILAPIMDKIEAAKNWAGDKVDGLKNGAKEAWNGTKKFLGFGSNEKDNLKNQNEPKINIDLGSLSEIILNSENLKQPSYPNITNSNYNSSTNNNRQMTNNNEINTNVYVTTNNPDIMLNSIKKANDFGIDKTFKDMSF